MHLFGVVDAYKSTRTKDELMNAFLWEDFFYAVPGARP
jgi:hypothetical protein